MLEKGSPSTNAGDIGAWAIACSGVTKALSLAILSMSVLPYPKLKLSVNLSVTAVLMLALALILSKLLPKTIPSVSLYATEKKYCVASVPPDTEKSAS